MRPLEMYGIDRVLLALEPVARDLGQHDLAKPVLPGKEFPIRYQRPRLRPEIGPEQSAPLLDRIRLDADLVLQAQFGMRDILIGLRQTDTVAVIEPAVIVAAQAALLDIAVGQIGAAMAALAVDQTVPAAEVLIENEVLAHQADRLDRAIARKLIDQRGRLPVLPHQFAGSGARPGARDEIVLFRAQHDATPRPSLSLGKLYDFQA